MSHSSRSDSTCSETTWPSAWSRIRHRSVTTERPDLLEDARFSDGFERHRHTRELVKILDEVFATRSLVEWEERLNAHALIWSPVREVAEVLEDPQAREMEYFRSVDHPRAGRFEMIAPPPLRLSEYEMRAERPAPDLGADSESVLREAGLSESEIAAALGRSAQEQAEGR